MSKGPKEAFLWKPSKTFDDAIVDANDDHVLELVGWGAVGGSMEAPGIAERRRMILELANLIELARHCTLGYSRANLSDKAEAILARIEGKPDA